MVKLYQHQCCRVENLVVEKVVGEEDTIVYSIATENLLKHYEYYKKHINKEAPASASLDWSVNVLRPQGLEVDSVSFIINNDAASVCVNTSNRKELTGLTLEVRATAKDRKKTLWFIGEGTAKATKPDSRNRGRNTFYHVYSDLEELSLRYGRNAVFNISCKDESDDLIRVHLREGIVDCILEDKGKTHSKLSNDLQVVATAMSFQPLFLEVLLNGTQRQHSKIESWLRKLHPTEVDPFLDRLCAVLNSQLISKDSLEKAIAFSHTLAGYAVDDFSVKAKTRKGNLYSGTYREWFQENIKYFKEKY